MLLLSYLLEYNRYMNFFGIAAVLVHAKDDRAKAFYEKCAEFTEFPQESNVLFLPMETLVATFSQIGTFE